MSTASGTHGGAGAADPTHGGGGGGGGYFGGGGGGFSPPGFSTLSGGGGGGSGYAYPGATDVAGETGVNDGDGSITLSWQYDPAVTLEASPAGGATVGDQVTLKVTVSGPAGAPTGTVAFGADGTDITGCTAQPLSGSPATATCTTSALPVGAHSLTAGYSGDSSYVPAGSEVTYQVSYPPVVVSTDSLPHADLGSSYSTTLRATGGAGAPYRWAVSQGELPDGLTLDPDTGTIAGSPRSAGSFPITMTATDGAQPPTTGSKQFTLVVDSVPLVITTDALPDGQVGEQYSLTFAAEGGLPPYTWEVTDGTLPDGLSLDATTGVLSGTPGAAGHFDVTVQVTDSEDPVTASTGFTLVVAAAPSPTTSAPSSSAPPSTTAPPTTMPPATAPPTTMAPTSAPLTTAPPPQSPTSSTPPLAETGRDTGRWLGIGALLAGAGALLLLLGTRSRHRARH